MATSEDHELSNVAKGSPRRHRLTSTQYRRMGEVRLIKMPLYARHGIPAVWLVDIEQDVLTCYAGSTGDAYRSASTPPDLAKIELESPAGVAIDLAAVFR